MWEEQNWNIELNVVDIFNISILTSSYFPTQTYKSRFQEQ